jgi:M6 family metalloprotease-like protein
MTPGTRAPALTSGTRRLTGVAITAALLLTMSLVGGLGSVAAQSPGDPLDHPVLQPIDAQDWVDMEFKTWDDYVQVRPDEWHDDTVEGSDVQFNAAVVLIDYADQPFLISQEQGSHPFGNPAPPDSPFAPWEPVEDVQAWFQEYFTVPNQYNGGQTIHSYWMETSHGRVGVTVDVFGPYTMSGKAHEWGLGHGPTGGRNLSSTGSTSVCPAGDQCTGRNIRTDGNLAWRTDMIADGLSCPLSGGLADCGYDFLLYTTAGHDESSTWEEQGRMIFQTHLDIPDEFGPPGAVDGPVLNGAGNPIPNYVNTRYLQGIPFEDGGFTSWRAGANQWPNASGGSRPSSTQAESSGQSTFAHEISHLFGQPDNYNNPFADNQRSPTAYWEMMSRGTFNGPGGTHNRWQVPNQGGSALGPHHMSKYKRAMNFFGPDDTVEFQRDELQDNGIAVATLQARAHQPGSGGYANMRVRFGTTTSNGQNARTCAALGYTGSESFWCHGNNNYHNYDVEVVDTVGNDSFVPGHGVLIGLTRNNNSFPSIWLIEPEPAEELLELVDYYRPDGTPVMVVRGDPRQINDATWHAGLDSGSSNEFVDDLNNLHFYILDTRRTDDGVLLYDIGVRRLTGAGAFERGAALVAATKIPRRQGHLASCAFPLTNTGAAGEGIYDSDVYRIEATSSSAKWQVSLQNNLAHAAAGETVEVQAHVLKVDDDPGQTTVTLTATSEADPTKSASATCSVRVNDTTPAAG